MINHTLVLADPVTVRCVSQVIGQPPQWLQVIQAVAAIATTVGVLLAVCVAVIRDPRNATRQHRHHVERMNALDHFKFGESWWTVKIDNAGNAVTTILAVDVTALDANGFEIPHGCGQAHTTMAFDQAFDRTLRTAHSESSNAPLPAVRQAMRDALAGHLVQEWPRILPPSQYAVMAYTTTDPSYEPRITVDFEDGYQWRRTDIRQPGRLGEEAR